MIYEATHSAISSPVSADGPKPCTLQDGPMTDLFGLALAPVSPSALRASSVAAVMSATYGLRSSGSSASAALQASLVSKLPELLASRGLTMWQQTWKTQVTPLRRRILAHTASAHRTSDSGSTGSGSWPTPKTSDMKGNVYEATETRRSELRKTAYLAPWPTPMAGTPAQNGNNAAGNNDSSRRTVELAHWPTPMALDHWMASTVRTDGGQVQLPNAAALAGWQTPQTRDHKGANLPGNELTHNARPLNEQARLTIGPTLPGSSAATEKPGQLNAAFSLWLMGYPVVAWLSAAPFRIPKAVKPASAYLAELESCEAPGTPSCPRSPPLS